LIYIQFYSFMYISIPRFCPLTLRQQPPWASTPLSATFLIDFNAFIDATSSLHYPWTCPMLERVFSLQNAAWYGRHLCHRHDEREKSTHCRFFHWFQHSSMADCCYNTLSYIRCLKRLLSLQNAAWYGRRCHHLAESEKSISLSLRTQDFSHPPENSTARARWISGHFSLSMYQSEIVESTCVAIMSQSLWLLYHIILCPPVLNKWPHAWRGPS